MPSYTEHVSLVKPNSTEKYNISVANMNMDLIDSTLSRIDKKDENQDKLLATKEELNTHIKNTDNPHKITKSQVGLSEVDNTSDENKPVSIAQREAINQSYTNATVYAEAYNARALQAEQDIIDSISTNKLIWDDKYTKNEIDNKFSTLETNIDWKEAVDTYNDILTAYPNPEDGWTVNVKDTDYTYRYNGKEWVTISANAIPKATNSVDGLLSKEDHINYDDANTKKHTHSNKFILDDITSDMINSWNNTVAVSITYSDSEPSSVTNGMTWVGN